MTIIDCCISLKMIKKILVVLGVVDMRQLLLNRLYALPFNGFVVNTPNKLPWAARRSSSILRGANSSRAALYLRSTLGSIGVSLSQFLYSSYVVFISEIMVGFQFK